MHSNQQPWLTSIQGHGWPAAATSCPPALHSVSLLPTAASTLGAAECMLWSAMAGLACCSAGVAAGGCCCCCCCRSHRLCCALVSTASRRAHTHLPTPHHVHRHSPRLPPGLPLCRARFYLHGRRLRAPAAGDISRPDARSECSRPLGPNLHQHRPVPASESVSGSWPARSVCATRHIRTQSLEILPRHPAAS
jgi:hypothetical protein